MDTKPLASFAVNARLKLLDAIASKLSSVLVEDSLARREQPQAVSALENQIASTSVDSVVSEMAYIWFNRFLVLTMLDQAGYNNPKAVTPLDGAVLPEILQRARAGVIDSEIHDDASARRIRGLLSGQIPSNSPDMEAYGILLRDVCMAWGKRFPLVFNSNYELADLLIPFELLSSSSIRAMFVGEIKGEYAEEVETIGWLFQFYNSDVKKTAFEKFKSGKKADHEDLVAATQIFTPKSVATSLAQNTVGTIWSSSHPESRIAATLPPISRGEFEDQNHLEPEHLTVLDPACGSGNLLLSAYDLLEEIYLESGYNPDSVPGLILSRNLHGLDIDQRAAALASFAIWLRASRNLPKIAALNLPQPNVHFLRDSEALFDLASECDDETRANRLRSAAKAGTLGSLVEITQADLDFIKETGEGNGLLGALLTDLLPSLELLSKKYSSVLANPPYMGPKNMPPLLKELIEQDYSEGKADLYAAFMVRCADLTRTEGRFSLVVQLSWMKLQRFTSLRRWFIDKTRNQAFTMLGSGIFEGVGSVVRSVVVSAGKTGREISSFWASGAQQNSARRLKLADFDSIPGSPFLFELPATLINAKSTMPTLANITSFNSGIKTGDNSSFLRYRWEVPVAGNIMGKEASSTDASSSRKWVPLVKGAGPSRWFSLCIDVIDWENGGERLKSGLKADGSKRNFQLMSDSFMFKPFVTYSDISEKAGFRFVPEGHLTNIASPAIHAPDLFWLLAFMNSSPVRKMIELSNPSLHIQQNDWSGVPILDEFPELSEMGKEAYLLSKNTMDTLEISPELNLSFWLGDRADGLESRLSAICAARRLAAQRIAEIEDSIDGLVSGRYEFPWLEVGEVEIETDSGAGESLDSGTSPEFDTRSILAEMLSLAVGARFGSLSNEVSFKSLEDSDNIAPVLEVGYFDDDLSEVIPSVLQEAFGLNLEGLNSAIEAILGKPLKNWLSKDFYPFHLKMYKNAPIYWMITSPKGHFKALTYIHRLSLDTFVTCRAKYVHPLIEKLESQRNALSSSDPKRAATLEMQIKDIRELDDLLYDLILKAPKLDFDEGVVKNHERFASVLRKLK